MMEKEYIVKNRLGLHARPAALFVQTTNQFAASIKVRKGDLEVDGKSIMGLMMLAAEEGASLVVIANGADEQKAHSSLEKLFNEKFGEKD